MNEMLLFFLAISVILYWWFTAQSRELAIAEAKRLCSLDALQFLDQTVELKKQWLSFPQKNRINQNRLRYCRLFAFEFATTGEQRYQGRILIVDGKIIKSDMDAYRANV